MPRWRLEDAAEYISDASNVAFVSLRAVLNRDDSFLELLESPVGSAFVRDPRTKRFVPARR